MAKRKSSKRLWEKLIIGIACTLVSLLACLYVFLSYRAVAVEKQALDTTEKYHSILYVDYDNTLILSDLYGEGLQRQVPIEPTREGYVFAGWESELNSKIYTTQATLNMAVVHDIAFKAVYSPIEYTVKWYNDDLTQIYETKYLQGETIPTIDNPVKEGYIFTGWDTAQNGYEITKVAMYIEETSNFICRVGNTYYTSINKANKATAQTITEEWLSNCKNGNVSDLNTIYLFRDIDRDYLSISGNKAATIELVTDITWNIAYYEELGEWQDNLIGVLNGSLHIKTGEYSLNLNTKGLGIGLSVISDHDDSFILDGRVIATDIVLAKADRNEYPDLAYPILVKEGSIINCGNFKILNTSVAVKFDGKLDQRNNLHINFTSEEHEEEDELLNMQFLETSELINAPVIIETVFGKKLLEAQKENNVYKYKVSYNPVPTEVSVNINPFSYPLKNESVELNALVWGEFTSVEMTHAFTRADVNGICEQDFSGEHALVKTEYENGVIIYNYSLAFKPEGTNSWLPVAMNIKLENGVTTFVNKGATYNFLSSELVITKVII